MKILHLCLSDLNGGAARAAFRLHKAQRKNGLNSHMLVVHKKSDDEFVHAVPFLTKLRIFVNNAITKKLLRLQKSSNPVYHSINILNSGLLKYINKLKPDIVNIHWIGGDMLSIKEVAKIKCRVVWTLHDMWAFCGAEHYENPKHLGRFISGYSTNNRANLDKGVDLDKIVFNKKLKHWKNTDITFVAPSNWMAEEIKSSMLFNNSDVHVVSNCIDTELYRPIDMATARSIYRLPTDRKLILFGAMSSTSDPRKGYHLLKDALLKVRNEQSDLELDLVVFGASKGTLEEETGFRTHYMGQITDDIPLVLLYNSADIFVAPSLQDNLPNTLVESLASGTPCVAFNIGGMNDLISAPSCGLLVNEVNSEQFGEKLLSMLTVKNPVKDEVAYINRNLRSETVIVDKYSAIYQQLTN